MGHPNTPTTQYSNAFLQSKLRAVQLLGTCGNHGSPLFRGHHTSFHFGWDILVPSQPRSCLTVAPAFWDVGSLPPYSHSLGSPFFVPPPREHDFLCPRFLSGPLFPERLPTGLTSPPLPLALLHVRFAPSFATQRVFSPGLARASP